MLLPCRTNFCVFTVGSLLPGCPPSCLHVILIASRKWMLSYLLYNVRAAWSDCPSIGCPGGPVWWAPCHRSRLIYSFFPPVISLEDVGLKIVRVYNPNSSTLATSCEELNHWKRLWCWEGLGAGGEGDDRGWDGWMASPTRWTWVCVNSVIGDGQGGLACCNSWGRKESDTTERLNWTELNLFIITQCTF